MLKMQIKVVGLDQTTMLPVVILTDQEEQSFLPLMIGSFEAYAISLALEGIEPERPMTHDLLLSTLNNLDVVVERVVITDLVDDVYYAEIHLKRDGQLIKIDARPSDSLALAARCHADIYVDDHVLSQAMIVQTEQDPELEEFKKFLEKVTPEDFNRIN